jgi:hypothetical protein
MIERYESKLGAMTSQFLKRAGALIQKARDLETIYFQVITEYIQYSPIFPAFLWRVARGPHTEGKGPGDHLLSGDHRVHSVQFNNSCVFVVGGPNV